MATAPGLRELSAFSSSGERPVVNIVFVHGLGGDSIRTWKAKSRQSLWPQEFLAQDLRQRHIAARILSFGYDASAAALLDPVSRNRLRQHGRNLAQRLYGIRRNATERPINFIGHSLGDLIVEETINSCYNSAPLDDKYGAIVASIIGICFIGTPHHGAELAAWAVPATNILSVYLQTNSAIVDILKADSEVLGIVEDRFARILRERSRSGRPVEVTCFCEELPMTVIGKNIYIVE